MMVFGFGAKKQAEKDRIIFDMLNQGVKPEWVSKQYPIYDFSTQELPQGGPGAYLLAVEVVKFMVESASKDGIAQFGVRILVRDIQDMIPEAALAAFRAFSVCLVQQAREQNLLLAQSNTNYWAFDLDI